MKNRVEIYQREDDRWAWRLVAANGQIIATDGGQGYENRQDLDDTLESIFGPEVADE